MFKPELDVYKINPSIITESFEENSSTTPAAFVKKDTDDEFGEYLLKD